LHEGQSNRAQDEDINQIARKNLRDLFNSHDADEIGKKVREFKLTWGDVTQNIITELTKNQNLVNKIRNLNSQRNQINNLLEGIRQKATPICRAIKDQQYDTRVDCCPTYWTLMKRFV
jgi:hypothetical protein